jgi:hypothetical protein
VASEQPFPVGVAFGERALEVVGAGRLEGDEEDVGGGAVAAHGAPGAWAVRGDLDRSSSCSRWTRRRTVFGLSPVARATSATLRAAPKKGSSSRRPEGRTSQRAAAASRTTNARRAQVGREGASSAAPTSPAPSGPYVIFIVHVM